MKRLSKNANLIAKIFAGFIVSLFLIVALTLTFLSNLIELGARKWLSDQGLIADIENIRINYLDAQLELTNLIATGPEDKDLKIGKAYLEFSWQPLQQNQIIITGVELADINITIEQFDDDLIISGLSLAEASSKEDTGTATTESRLDEHQDASATSWLFKLEKLHLANINVCYQQILSNRHTKNKIIGNDVCLQLGSLDWNGNINFKTAHQNGTASFPLKIDGELTFNDIRLINNSFDKNNLTFDKIILGNSHINVNNRNIDHASFALFNFEKLELSNINACHQQTSRPGTNPLDGYCFSLGKLNWSGDIQFTPVEPDQTLPYVGLAGSLMLDKINIVNKHLNRTAINIHQLSINDIAIDSLDKLTINELSLLKFKALQNDKSPAQNIANFEHLNVKNIQLSNFNNLTVNNVHLDGLMVSIIKQNSGQFEFEQWLPATSPASSGNSETRAITADTNKSPSFEYAVKSVGLTNTQLITYEDLSLNEKFYATVKDVELQAGPIDSSKPLENTQLTLSAKIYDHGSIEASGTITPLSPEHTFNIEGKIRGLDLRKFNPYVKNAIAHTINSGQLDSDLSLKAIDGQLDSNIDLTLYHFKLEPLSKEAEEKLDDTFGMPLNSSLALIRERDGSINISVDITGDADVPDFNPVEIVTKAISTSIAKAVVVFYTPYGLVVGADVLYSLATALRFDPVDFDAGSDLLNTSNIDKFTKISALLKERSQVHIELCGLTNNADVLSLFGPEVKLNDEKIDQLLQLTRNRAIVTKQHLVENENIAADRIILCTPKRENVSTSEISGVEITI